MTPHEFRLRHSRSYTSPDFTDLQVYEAVASGVISPELGVQLLWLIDDANRREQRRRNWAAIWRGVKRVFSLGWYR